MNIFVTNECPVKSANFLQGKRALKMIIETGQLLSTACHELGFKDARLYKPTHVNHPCTIWARQNKGNYAWLLAHFRALCALYTTRYGKIHLTEKKLSDVLTEGLEHMPDGERTPFVNCAANKSLGISYKYLDNVYEAYRLYLAKRNNALSEV